MTLSNFSFKESGGPARDSHSDHRLQRTRLIHPAATVCSRLDTSSGTYIHGREQEARELAKEQVRHGYLWHTHTGRTRQQNSTCWHRVCGLRVMVCLRQIDRTRNTRPNLFVISCSVPLLRAFLLFCLVSSPFSSLFKLAENLMRVNKAQLY